MIDSSFPNRRRLTARLLGTLLLLPFLLPDNPVQAQTAPPAAKPLAEAQQRYQDCMRQTTRNPEQALKEAETWRAGDGGFPAEHCAAVALLNQQRFEEGAQRLTAMADSMIGMDRALRIATYGQAGQAWTMAGDSRAALAVQNRGLEIDPDNVELLIDRSFSHSLLKDHWAALDDLLRAGDLAPGRADILVFRATTYRFLETPELALDDINRALEIDPNRPEALLERGILRHKSGDSAGARADWERLLQVAPQSAAAISAQRNLERLE